MHAPYQVLRFLRFPIVCDESERGWASLCGEKVSCVRRLKRLCNFCLKRVPQNEAQSYYGCHANYLRRSAGEEHVSAIKDVDQVRNLLPKCRIRSILVRQALISSFPQRFSQWFPPRFLPKFSNLSPRSVVRRIRLQKKFKKNQTPGVHVSASYAGKGVG